MKRLYSFFVGIVAIILVLWGISYKLEADSTQGTLDKLVSIIGAIILILNY